MPLTLVELETSAKNGVQTARKAHSKGDAAREFVCLKHVIGDLLRVAVRRFPDGPAAEQFLTQWDANATLNRLLELNQQFARAAFANPNHVAVPVDNDITLVHVAWLQGNWNIGRSYLDLCLDPSIEQFVEPSTAFWKEYHRAIGDLVANRPYVPKVPKVKGYEQYWVPYLHMIETLTSGRDARESENHVKESFVRRNCDKRLIDWEGHDGDGKSPALWDFREFTILKYWQSRDLSE